MNLVERLIKNHTLRTPQIINAFKKIKRIDFLPDHLKDLAELDEALPIGWGQTISQPTVVAFMFELLQPREGEKILDVGFGSGWTTALLAEIVGEKGKVFGIEILPQVFEFGKKNISKYNFLEKGRVKLILGDGSQGYPEFAPFDKILVSASAKECPPALKRDLRIGGRLVIPIRQSLFVFKKIKEDEFEKKEFPGFLFVPLLSKI